MRRPGRRHDGWRHPLERPAAVYLDEDDPLPERRANVLRDPPTNETPEDAARRHAERELPEFYGVATPGEQPDPGPAQAAGDADNPAGHGLTEDEARWLD